MGKAHELVDHALSHPLTPEEIADERRPIGALQLRADVPTMKVDETTPAQQLLERLIESEDVVALTGRDARTLAVAVPVEKYLRLAQRSANLGSDTNFRGVRTGMLPLLHVEEVNPHDPDAPPSPLDDTLR
jgi:hypothetical protein